MRKKGLLRASSAVIKYDSLIAYLFMCHSKLLQTYVTLLCTFILIQGLRLTQLLTNINYVVMFLSSHKIPDTLPCCVKQMYTINKDFTLKGAFCLWAWVLMIKHLSHQTPTTLLGYRDSDCATQSWENYYVVHQCIERQTGCENPQLKPNKQTLLIE